MDPDESVGAGQKRHAEFARDYWQYLYAKRTDQPVAREYGLSWHEGEQLKHQCDLEQARKVALKLRDDFERMAARVKKTKG